MSAPRSVLFLCSSNSVRSPMAAGLVPYLFGNLIFAQSAGVEPGEPDSIAAQVMRELGVDIAVPHALSDLDDTHFDLVVALSTDARAPAEDLARRVGAEAEHWPTPDPTMFEGSREMRLAAYRELRDKLAARIKERLAA